MFNARNFTPAVSAATLVAMTVLAGCGAIQRPGATAARGFAAVAFSNTSELKEVVLEYGSRDKLTQLVAAGMDAWSVDVKNKRVKGKVNEAQAALAEKLGMRADFPTRETPMKADPGYRNYDKIQARMKELAAKHPDFVTVVDIGDSWETTKGTAKRDILALRINKNPGKPIVTFAGCHHARELVTPEMVLKQAEMLVEGYGTDAECTSAIENREIWLLPLVNPDAHTRAVQGNDWRKNANNETGGKRRVGVDLNRNYDIAWGTVGDSGQPEADTFRGSKPFSEPETQAVRDLLSKHVPVIYLTFHSFSNAVMWSWDHKTAPPTDPRLPALGMQLGKLSGYEAYQGCEMYLNSGDDIDWVHAKYGTLSYTVEVGGWSDGFMPSYSKLGKFWDQNRPMMMHCLKVADNPGAVFGPAIKVASTGGNLMVDAGSATKVEMFEGKIGAAGTGRPVAMTGNRAMTTMAAGPKHLVYVRAQGKNGVWGPTEVTWSK